MKLVRIYWLLLSLLFGLTLILLSACGNTVRVTRSQDGKIVLYPKYGDDIVWDTPGKSIQVRFFLPFCKEGGDWLTECHVNVKPDAGQFGRYDYICKNGLCQDPEVDVGTSNGPVVVPHPIRSKGPEADFRVVLPCTNNTIQVIPSDVPDNFYTMTPKPGNTVEWLSNGLGSQYLNDWTVTFDDGNATVCEQADIHDEDGYRTCKIKQGLPPKAYRYAAASSKCQSGSGTITVQ